MALKCTTRRLPRRRLLRHRTRWTTTSSPSFTRKESSMRLVRKYRFLLLTVAFRFLRTHAEDCRQDYGGELPRGLWSHYSRVRLQGQQWSLLGSGSSPSSLSRKRTLTLFGYCFNNFWFVKIISPVVSVVLILTITII